MSAPLSRRSFTFVLLALTRVNLRAFGPAKRISTPSFLHPNDRWVVLRSDHDFEYQIMDLENGQLIKILPSSECDTYYGAPRFFFDPSGRYLLQIYDGHHGWSLKRWDLQGEADPLLLDLGILESELKALSETNPEGAWGEHGVFPFMLPAPGGLIRFPRGERDLKSFKLVRQGRDLLRGPFLPKDVHSISCRQGHKWDLEKEPKSQAKLTNSANPGLAQGISLLPAFWRPSETMGGGNSFQYASREGRHSVLVWSGYSTVRELECPSGKVLRCLSGSMPQSGLVTFGNSKQIVFCARPLDTTVRWNRLGQPKKVLSPANENVQKPPIDELGPMVNSGDAMRFEQGTRAIAWSGSRLAIGRDDGRVVLGPTGSQKAGPWPTLGKHSGAVRALAFASVQPWLVSGARDGSLKLWDLGTAKLLRDLASHEARVNSVVLIPGGRSISAGPDGIRIVELETGRLVRHIETGGVWVSDLSVSPDGEALFSAMLDGTLRRWDLKSGAQVWSVDAGEGWCAAVAFDPTGQSVAVGYELGAIALWDVANGKRLRRIHVDATTAWQKGCRSVHSVAWSPGGEVLAVAFGDAVRIYDRQLTSGPGAGWLLPLDWGDSYT